MPGETSFSTQLPAILVVEDEDTLRTSVSKILRKRGFSVIEAADGNLALELIRAKVGEFSVVLLDLNLPGKSSHEVLEELRRARPGVKVILTSAYARDSLNAEMEGLGDGSFIRKPYHLSELVGAVREALPKN